MFKKSHFLRICNSFSTGLGVFGLPELIHWFWMGGPAKVSYWVEVRTLCGSVKFFHTKRRHVSLFCRKWGTKLSSWKTTPHLAIAKPRFIHQISRRRSRIISVMLRFGWTVDGRLIPKHNPQISPWAILTWSLEVIHSAEGWWPWRCSAFDDHTEGFCYPILCRPVAAVPNPFWLCHNTSYTLMNT